MSFYQQARDVNSFSPIGHVGEVFRTSDYQSISVANSDPQAAPVKTVTVDTAANSTAYTLTIDGVTVSYTSDASATKPEISAGLKAAIDAEPGHRVTVADDGVDTLTITGLWPGVDFVLSESDANLSTATTTSADAADPLYPGRVLVIDGEINAYDGTGAAKHPVAADYTAQSKTVVITTGAAASFVAVLRVNGQEYRAALVPHNTDATTTGDDIVTAFDAVAPANTVAVVNTTGTLVFTAEVAGLEFDVEIIASGVTADAETTAAVGPSAATSLVRNILGMAARRLDTEAATLGGDQQLPGNGGAECARRGRMVVARDSSETWTMGQDLYVGVATATAGLLYNTAGANRVYIGRDLITPNRSSDNDLAVVQITVGA